MSGILQFRQHESRKLELLDQTYRDGYTNDDNLIGNTDGRKGREVQAWFTFT